MNESQVLERVKEMLKDKYDIEVDTLTGDSRQEDIGLDSMTMVDLMLDIETELDFTFASLDLPKNPSLNEIVALIQDSLAKA